MALGSSHIPLSRILAKKAQNSAAGWSPPPSPADAKNFTLPATDSDRRESVELIGTLSNQSVPNSVKAAKITNFRRQGSRLHGMGGFR